MELIVMVEALTSDWATCGKITKRLSFNISESQGMLGRLYLQQHHTNYDKDYCNQGVEPPKAHTVVLEAT
jgi:hypothetical protein